MDYANLPNKVLKTVLGDIYGVGKYTVRDELKKAGEDIIWAEYSYFIEYPDKLATLTVWTDHFVGLLVDTILADKCIVFVDRNPPERKINKRFKK